MVSKADFFVGNTTRSECEARVKAANHGDFVVRQDSDGQYSLIVNDDSNAVQFKVRMAKNHIQPLNVDSKIIFGSLRSI